MNVQTKSAITINTGMTSSVSEVLKMKIFDYSYTGEFSSLTVAGKYYYEDGGNEVLVKPFSKTFDIATINSMYSSLTTPTFTNKVDFDKEVAYMAGIIVMAAEYGIPEEDLEINP